MARSRGSKSPTIAISLERLQSTQAERADEVIMRSRSACGNSRSSGFGWCGVARALVDRERVGHHARHHRAVLGTVNAPRCAPSALRRSFTLPVCDARVRNYVMANPNTLAEA